MAEQVIRVLCVDDNALITEAMTQLIDLTPGMCSVGHLEAADGLLEAAEERSPDVIVLDLKMPGRDPMEALAELKTRMPAVQVVVSSGFEDNEAVERAMAAGASGFVPKNGKVDAILQSIRDVVRHDH